MTTSDVIDLVANIPVNIHHGDRKEAKNGIAISHSMYDFLMSGILRQFL